MQQDGPVQITPTGGPLGAVVTDIDLGSPQSVDQQTQLRQAWLDHLLLIFPDQPLSEDAFLVFARTLGEPGRYPFVTGLATHPDIIEVKKLEHERNNFGGIWHSDTVYLDEPPMASMLVAREIPPTGGDTKFANMYAAWEQLPTDLQRRIESLTAIHRSDLADVAKTRSDRLADPGQPARRAYRSEHPAVRTHPETGRKSLFVNIAHTCGFVGMSEPESQPILDALFKHQIRPEFTWRMQWQPATIALWDNRCLLHNPINDYDGYRRLMHRITLKGDIPR